VRGATSSVGTACLELARADGLRVVATTRSSAKSDKLTRRGAAAVVLEGDGFVERARAELPQAGADGVVDLIGGRAVLDSLQLVRPGRTVCNSGLLGGEWVIDDFEPVAMIPSGRKLTSYHSNDAADAGVGGPLLRTVIEQVERGTVDPGIDRVYTLDEIRDAHRRMAAGEATGKLVVLTGARP
jgi:NADPH:quinone reductase-like Zn-dependent oxidoreductase